MQRIEGTSEVPVIYTAHHASHDFGKFATRVALTPEQQFRFSDYGIDETVPHHGIAAFIAGKSRALGDLNRDPDDPGRFQDKDYGRPERNNIWRTGQELTVAEKEYCDRKYYEPFHDSIVEELHKRSELTFVVAWDNTAHYVVGNDENGIEVMMKPIILSNRGKQGSTEPGEETVSCDPRFLKLLVGYFREELIKVNLPSEICLNLVMKGGYICRQYSSLRNQEQLESLGI